MIFPSIYVFTLFLIAASEEDNFCKEAYEDCELDDAYSCQSKATGPTDLTKIGKL